MFHERLAEVVNNKGFIPHNENVGWIEGPHGTSHSVTGVVIGRDLLGLVTKDNGRILFHVDTYVKPTGNLNILTQIPGSDLHQGLSGVEVKITQELSPEYAMRLSYTSTKEELKAEQEVTLLNSHESLQNLKK
jgi:hypothetical protein